MASFSYASTEETTNANRVCRLLLGPCTDQLRDLLRHHVPTSTFPSVINHNSYKLPRLTLPQKNLILPNKGCYSGNYDDMDISLLYILLRNISGIPQHINGWGFDPVSTDRTTSANIERIRTNRNQCVHSTNPTLTNAEFNLIWSSVRSAVVEIDNYLSNGNKYEKEVDLLRHETMDPVRDKHYRDELDRQTKEDQATRDTVNELKRKCSTEQKEVKIKIKKIDNEISSMKSNSSPQNLRDQTRKEIEQHTRENTFVEIEAVRKFIAIHADKDVFLITGRPGIGKSKNGLELLRQLGGKYPKNDVIKISDLHLVEMILNKDSRMILLLEDVFGKTNCKYSEDNDKSVLDKLQSYVSSGSVKVIFTIRSVVKRSLQYQYLFSSHRIFKGFEEVDLDSSQFKMSVVEKKRLLLNYCSISNIRIVNAWENENYNDETILDKNVPVRFSEATLINIVNIETYLGFPESCYMFTTNRALTRLGIQFFKHPSRFLNQEIDCLRKNGENYRKERICYITLVYILLSSNTLKINDFDERKVASILKSCYNREGFILKSEIVDAAEEMTGSYLTYNAEISVFQFQHQTIFESIMLSYYKVDPSLVLTTIDFEMIREIVKLCNYHAKKEEIRMIVPKELYGDLAKRLCLIFNDQFSHMPSNFIKVICDSDLMTEIDADFINQLGEHFMEASNYNISTIITYDGKSEEVVFCLLAALLWYSTIKDWKTEDIKVILHSLKTQLLSETRSNVINACKRSIVAAFLYLCYKKNTNDIIKFFLQTIDELEISFDINRCFQDVADRQNQPVASCILQHFSKKINIVEVFLETDREKLHVLINILSRTFFCSNVQFSGLVHDRKGMIKWLFTSVDPAHFNMTEAVLTSGNNGLMEVVDWFIKTFQYKLFNCQVLMKEACSKGWEIVVKRFLKEDACQSYDFKSIMIAACQYSWHTIAKELLENSTMETFEVTDLMTEACKKSDFENVTSLIIYIAEKDISLRNTIKNVFEALKNNASWCLFDFCTNFVKVLLTQIDSDKTLTRHEDLKSLRTINLFLDCVSETTFNFRVAVAESISDDIVHKQNVLQLFIKNRYIKKIHVPLILLDACKRMNSKFVIWLLKNIDSNLLNITHIFDDACKYRRQQIIEIIINHIDHKLLNFTSAFLNCIKEEWMNHNGQNEVVMKFLLKKIDHKLFELGKIAKQTIIYGLEDVMNMLLINVDIQSFDTEVVVDDASEQGLLGIVERFWKSENKEKINALSAVNRALKGNKLDIVNWFRQNIDIGLLKICVPLDTPILNSNTWEIEIITYLFKNEYTLKIYIDEVIEQNRTDLLAWLYQNYNNIKTQFNEIITRAFMKEKTNVVMWILDHVDGTLIDMKTAFIYSLQIGYVNIVIWILENVDAKMIAMNETCMHGFVNTVKWMLYKVFPRPLLNVNTTILSAIYLNHSETVQWMILNVAPELLCIQEVILFTLTNMKSFSIAKFLLETVNHNMLDMKTVMDIACKSESLDIVKCVLDKVDHTLLDMKSAMIGACEAGNTDIVKCILDKVDHNLIDFKVVISKLYENCHNYGNEQTLHVLKVIVENVDWKQVDMKTVMNFVCKFNRLDIVECILEKEDHKLLDTKSVMIQACEAGNTDIAEFILDKVDHNLIDFKVVISKLYENCNNYYRNEQKLHVLKVIVENVDWKQLDMKTVMNLVCKFNRLDIVECILEKEDHKLLDTKSAMIQACKAGNTDIAEFIFDKVDHNLIDFKVVISKLYESCHYYCRNEQKLHVLKVIVENVDWKQLDMKTVMNLVCKFNSLDIVECILEKEDHKLLDTKSAMIQACEAGNTDIAEFILDKVDHNLIDFKDVLYECYKYGDEFKDEDYLGVFEVIVKNVDWKRLDMKTVMNVASCKLESSDTVKCILDKVDHTLLNLNSAIINAFKARNIYTIRYLLDKVDHNLIEFKDILYELHRHWDKYEDEGNLLEFQVIVENVDWKRLDMKTVMNLACKLNSLDIVECILEKEDHKLLDTKSAMIQACKAGNTDIAEFILDKVDHNLIDFKVVISKLYENCHNYYRNEQKLHVLKVIVENVDWKQLDMKTVMNLVCKFNSLDIVECILEKEDHKLLDTKSAMIQACEAGNTDIAEFILDKVDHNLIDFKDVLYECYKYGDEFKDEDYLGVFEVIVKNVDWKRLDMKTVMNLVCKFNRLDIVKCILDKVDHTLLDMKSAMIGACEAGNTDIVKCILDKVDHNLIDFKVVISKLYENCHNYRNEQTLHVLKVIVENVDWKRLDIKTVMNLACKLNNLDIVECILEKEDHKLLDTKSAMIQACEAGNTDIAEFILDKVDHNLIDFKDVLYECYKYGDEFEDEDYLGVFEVIVKNVDWKRLDMKTVMNVASCKLESSDTVKCILDKVDHTLLNLNSAIINAFKARNIYTIRYLLDKVDHNLIEFKDILYELHRHWDKYEDEGNLLEFQVIVENVDWKRLDMKTVMNLACKLNSLDMVECILDKVEHILLDMKSAMIRACEAGNTDIVKCILDHVDHEMLDMNSGMTAAIKRHNLSIVKYLCNNVNKISLNMKEAFNEACKVGKLTLVKWILDNGDQSQLNIQTAMLKACRGPNDETVKLLYQRFGENMFDIKSSMNNACRYGNIDVIRWLWSKTDKQHVCDMKSALINACLSGKEGNVKWLVENIDQSQFDIQASITETFVNGINVMNIVKTLLNYSDRSSVNMNTVVVEACAIGNMTLVKWLLETDERHLLDINQALYSVLNVHSKISENDNVYKKSVTREKRSLVMWVLEEYSPSLFDMNNTVKEICRNGWTEILQWIWGNSQDHSLEIGPAINVACVNGHKELVEWALSNIDVNSLDTETLMNESCGNGLLTLAKWMWENIEHSKLDMITAMNEACSYSRIETAQWILENVDANLLDTRNIINEASKHGWLSVVKDLLKDAQLSQDDIRSTIIEACMNGHLEIVEYMFTKFGKDICDIESILPGLCSNPVNKEVAKFLISHIKNQLRLFANVMPQACEFGWTEVVDMLLENINHTEIEMKGPLLNACKNGEFDIVKIILSKVDHSELNIAEAFIVLCTRGWDEIAEFLLDELDHTAFDMKAALTEASRSGEEDIVQLLFKKVKPEKFDIEMAIDAASHNHMHENIVYQLLQRNYNATFELNRLKKKAEEYDWPKVLSTIRKFNSEQK